MAFTLEFSGIQSQPFPETRSLVFFEVIYDQTTYSWAMFVPDVNDAWAYVQSHSNDVKNQIDSKEAEWQALTPKTRTITDIDGNQITVDISKDEVVRPDIPDYYAKRRAEYPSIGDQLDSFWKGVGSPEYLEMQQKILEIKQKYPKP